MDKNNLPLPGPWAWFGDGKCGLIYLATAHSGRRTVMDFQRWGMQGAQPLFQEYQEDLNYGIMKPAKEMFKFQVGNPEVTGFEEAKADASVYRYDISDIDNPNARLISKAPEIFEALQLLITGVVVKCDQDSMDARIAKAMDIVKEINNA